MNLPTFLQSSVDPEQLSHSVQSALLTVSAIVLWIAAHYGFSLSSDQYTQAVSNVTQIVFCAGTAFGTVQTLYGLLRKVLIRSVTAQ